MRSFTAVSRVWILLLECILVLLIRQLVLQAIGGVLEAVACLDLFLLDFVLFRELLGLFDHTLNFLLCQATLVVCDGDLLASSAGLVLSLTFRIPFASISKVTSIW